MQRKELERFCAANQIPVCRRPDIWGDLLDPFLDTSPAPDHEAAVLGRLHQAGLSGADIGQMRAKVGPLLLAYNAVYWDWAHLGLADLLDAAATTTLPDCAGLGEISSLYSWAMGIAHGTGAKPVA